MERQTKMQIKLEIGDINFAPKVNAFIDSQRS